MLSCGDPFTRSYLISEPAVPDYLSIYNVSNTNCVIETSVTDNSVIVPTSSFTYDPISMIVTISTNDTFQ